MTYRKKQDPHLHLSMATTKARRDRTTRVRASENQTDPENGANKAGEKYRRENMGKGERQCLFFFSGA